MLTNVAPPFGSILAPFWGLEIVIFSCDFLASFLDAFLEASGCNFDVILVVIGRSFLILFLTL